MSQPITARYEATVATGLESLAEAEIQEKLNVKESSNQKGRVFFTTDSPVEDILKLRSINNLFVIIYDCYLDDSDIPESSANLEPLLMRIGDQSDWSIGLQKWKDRFQFASCIDVILSKDDKLRDQQPKFRVSCNRYGPKHNFTSPEICSVFGHVVDTKFGWPIKMTEFDLEVMVNFSENHVYIGLTLTPIALDRRNIVSVGWTTLRAATSYALLRTAQIELGDIIVDPMSGSGSIPVECCDLWMKEWTPFVIAGELRSVSVMKSKTNMDIIKPRPPWDVLNLDATKMPFLPESVDVFVSDLPFGKRHGNKKLNKSLYPALLTDMARVSRLGTARAVLLTQDFKSMNLASDRNRSHWTQKQCKFVKIGNLNCYIYLFIRTTKKFTS